MFDGNGLIDEIERISGSFTLLIPYWVTFGFVTRITDKII